MVKISKKIRDISYEWKEQESCIIDISIVQLNNQNRRYNEKMNKYKKLIEMLRKEKHIKKKTIISVIITTDCFINQFSLNNIQKLNIKVEWEQTIRKMIIDQMKYLLYDIHQEVVDLGSIETKYAITF